MTGALAADAGTLYIEVSLAAGIATLALASACVLELDLMSV